jgi:hypothetical protein
MIEINNFSKISLKNKELIEKSKKCGCYYCLKIFESKEIKKWTDEKNTAICPYCGIDSVVGDNSVNITPEILAEANKYWF